MSRFESPILAGLTPYTPGEQPKDKTYIKLNTNESPFPPSPMVMQAVSGAEVEKLNLYSDPTLSAVTTAVADYYDLTPDCVVAGNGSDEILAFAFQAWGHAGVTAPDITYGFYPVFASFFGLPYKTIPVMDNLEIDVDKMKGAKGMLVLANPNAQTGIYLSQSEIEELVASDTNRMVIVDEAYIDFGGESAVPLTKIYDNLLVVQTFSKSRNLAGGRVGLGIGHPSLIRDLNTLRYSFNPYNINRLSLLAAEAAMKDISYFKNCTQEVMRVREITKQGLLDLGFKVAPSLANFILAESDRISGKELYLALKEKGILVRYLGDDRIQNYVRITIGTEEQMACLIKAIKDILEAL